MPARFPLTHLDVAENIDQRSLVPFSLPPSILLGDILSCLAETVSFTYLGSPSTSLS